MDARALLRAAAAAALSLAAAAPAGAQRLALPPRPTEAPGGAEIARELRGLELEAREERIFAEVSAGNVPGWLRALRPVEVAGDVGGRRASVTFWVTPDYLSVGSDVDAFPVPLSPGTAQRIADLVGAALPTPRMVDAIWAAADVRLEPQPIPPSPAMTTVEVFEEHAALVRAQRAGRGGDPGLLVAGHKKDVVVAAVLAEAPGKVAIYGWHRPDGTPIQPLYAGHTERWVDYSHGVRLVLGTVRVDGVERPLRDVLADPRLAPLLSSEGAIPDPRYPTKTPPS